ncbi:MAG: hypothetical protein H0V01_11930 [Bacteroidetes bacterium]|nr:hypothetical protein [Bacteroidota bacterium]
MKKLVILTFVLIFLSFVGFHFLLIKAPLVHYYSIGFFFVITVLTHYFLTKAAIKSPGRFPAYYMGGVTLKLFISMIFIVIYAVLNKGEAKVFLLSFFILYLIYTSFETILILKHLNRPK